jgi:hypothetical protein
MTLEEFKVANIVAGMSGGIVRYALDYLDIGKRSSLTSAILVARLVVGGFVGYIIGNMFMKYPQYQSTVGAVAGVFAVEVVNLFFKSWTKKALEERGR